MTVVRPRRGIAALVAAGAAAALGAGVLTAAPASADSADRSARTALGATYGSIGAGRPDSSGVLSARLSELATPAVAGASAAVRARAMSMPESGPGALIEDPAGRVLVTVRLAAPAAAARLSGLGEVVDVSAPMSRATMRILPSRLAKLAATPGVVGADAIPAPITGAATAGSASTVGATAAARSAVKPGTCRPVVSEADAHLRAAAARAIAKVDGRGVTVAVLSDSYNRDGSVTTAAQDIKAGELPGSKNPCGRTAAVKVLKDLTESQGVTGSDEGRAMLQLVHDVAPGANLQFATAFEGEDAMASRIRSLPKSGADVIVDDVSYFSEPFFQSGVVDQAIEAATAAGVSYFSAAGNSNLILGGKNVSSWETPATRLGACPYVDIFDCVNFSTTGTDNRYQLSVAPGGVVIPVIQWAEPVNGVTDDFDAYLIDTVTGDILSPGVNAQLEEDGTPGPVAAPYEAVPWYNGTGRTMDVSIVITRYYGSGTPRLKIALVRSAGVNAVEYATSQGGDIVGPTVFGHNGGQATISVGAVRFDTKSAPEKFSSRGPVTHYFGPVRGTTPAAPLGSPTVITAPDLAATDGARTSFFAQRVSGAWRFFGTSAAAPHAAAVAALLLDQRPNRTPAQVLAALTSTAAKVGSASPSAVGAGLVDALEATTGITGPVSKPGAVGKPKVKAKKRAVKVTVTRPTNTGGLAITGYTATCTPAKGKARSVSGAKTKLKVTGLTAGVTYRCTAAARNALGTGKASPASKKVTPKG